MPRKQPVDVAPDAQPEGVAPSAEGEKPAKPKKAYVNKKKLETPFQKVTRRLERAKRAYEKLPDSDDPQSPEGIAKTKAKKHLDGCVERYAKVANPQPELEVAEPQPA